MQQSQKWISFFLVIIFLGIGVRLWNGLVYPLRAQHDPDAHLYVLEAASRGEFYPNYNAPWYYFTVAAIAKPVVFVSNALGFTEGSAERLSVFFGNFILFLAFLIGLYKLFQSLQFTGINLICLIAFSATSPLVHGALNMVRSENLMLIVLPWILFLALEVFIFRPAAKNRKLYFIIFSILLGVSIAQKIGGLTIFGSLGLIALFLHSKIKNVILYLFPALLIAFMLGFVHYSKVGVTPFQSNTKYNAITQESLKNKNAYGVQMPSAKLFLRFNPVKIWKTPFRDFHADSMWNILFVDFYGDYWRYRIDHYQFLMKESLRNIHARLGLFCTSIFLCLFILGLLSLRNKQMRSNQIVFKLRLSLLLFFISGLMYVVTVALFSEYNPRKFDIIKWEYFVWSVPFLYFPIGVYLENTKKPWLYYTCGLLCLGGIVQSVIVPF